MLLPMQQQLGQEVAIKGVLSKKVFLKVSQISQENTCHARPETLLKSDSNTGVFL